MQTPVNSDARDEHEPVFVEEEPSDREIKSQCGNVHGDDTRRNQRRSPEEMASAASQQNADHCIKLFFITQSPRLDREAKRRLAGEKTDPGPCQRQATQPLQRRYIPGDGQRRWVSDFNQARINSINGETRHYRTEKRTPEWRIDSHESPTEIFPDIRPRPSKRDRRCRHTVSADHEKHFHPEMHSRCQENNKL